MLKVKDEQCMECARKKGHEHTIDCPQNRPDQCSEPGCRIDGERRVGFLYYCDNHADEAQWEQVDEEAKER